MKQTYDRIGEICEELCETLRAKNANYGDTASQPPYFTPWLDPETGLWVRLSDKVARLKALRTREDDKVGESVRDTLLDTAGYAIRLIIELDKRDNAQTAGDNL